MEFEWDEKKERWTREARGFDFDFASRLFNDPHRIDRPDNRRAYGEARRQTIGRIGQTVYFIAYTMRNGVVRIISARNAHDNEEKNYWNTLGATPDD